MRVMTLRWMKHYLQRIIGRRRYSDEDRFTVGTVPVHAVQHRAVHVDVEVGGRAKAPDQRSNGRRQLPRLIRGWTRDRRPLLGTNSHLCLTQPDPRRACS